MVEIEWCGGGDSGFEFIGGSDESLGKREMGIFESLIEMVEFLMIGVKRYWVWSKICI